MTELSNFLTVNDIEALGSTLDAVREYDDSIETASEDTLRNWILSKDYTSDELEDHLSCGFTIRELAENLQIQGHIFP